MINKTPPPEKVIRVPSKLVDKIDELAARNRRSRPKQTSYLLELGIRAAEQEIKDKE